MKSQFEMAEKLQNPNSEIALHPLPKALSLDPPLALSDFLFWIGVYKPKLARYATRHLHSDLLLTCTLGCPARTKFWSWTYCFSPELTTGPNSSNTKIPKFFF